MIQAFHCRKLIMIQLLMICCLLGLGSAWNQPTTCYMRQSVRSQSGDSEYKEDVGRIRETLERTLPSLESSLTSISASLQQLVAQGQDCQESPTTTDSEPPTPATTTEPPTPAITTEPLLPVGSFQNPASSCRDIPQDSPSGEYWIRTSNLSSPVKVYCDMDRSNCSCNDTEGWMRVANLDMTDSSQQCPDEFRLVNRITAPLRTCERPGAGCVSTVYQTYGVEYSHVCGQIRGYQDGTTDAFNRYHLDTSLTIDSIYVDGVSLTHGQSPRQHIWTFAAAVDEIRSQRWTCPCTQPEVPYTGTVPPFIGQDYFCETGSRDHYQFHTFYPDDPLWDGQGCGGTSTCCEFNNPPWFCKQLPQLTTDNIELRLCHYVSVDNTPLELVEIYVR